MREAYAADQSIPWRRIHKLPDYVGNFPHHMHVDAGVSCYSCHGQIRGMPVERALAQLQFSPKRPAQDVRKLLQSAIANAENNHGLDIDSLVVAEAHVGKNLVMKRIRARARGRAARIMKPFSQLTIVLRDTSVEAEAA